MPRTGEARQKAIQIFNFKDAYISEDEHPNVRTARIDKSKALMGVETSLANNHHHHPMEDGQHRGSPDASPHEANLISPEQILELSPPPKPLVSSNSTSPSPNTAIETEI